ncbi:unnamed protein product [Cochlearia groenlandica]
MKKAKEISLSSTSPLNNDQDLNSCCLSSNDVSKPVYLFGVIISEPSQVSSSLASTSSYDQNNLECTITKVLTASDVGFQSRLMLEKSDFERHILSHLPENDKRRIQVGGGVSVNMYDHDTDTKHVLVMKRMVNTTRCYVINGGWLKHIVRRRALEKGDKIGLTWNKDISRLHFCVISRRNSN